MSDPFKSIDVADVFTPELLATFKRPHEDNDTIVIIIPDRHKSHAQFHLDAGTLRVIAEVLQYSPSTKGIQ
jgi:hypothetical protein